MTNVCAAHTVRRRRVRTAHSIAYRIEHAILMMKEGVVTRWVGSALGSAYLFLLLRDEIIRPRDVDDYRLAVMFTHMPLAYWLVIGIAILCAWKFEASYRITKKLRNEIAELKRELSKRR